jgi:hypothetical protein
MAVLPREAGFAPILLHEGPSQASLKWLGPPQAGLRFLDRAALVEHIKFVK